MNSQEIRVFLRYALIGAGNTTVCFLLMALGFYWGWNYLLSTGFAYGITILMSFFLNLIFTFRAQGAIGRRLILFLILNGCNILVVEGIEYVLIECAYVYQYLAIMIGMLWYIITGFIMNRQIVYRRRIT